MKALWLAIGLLTACDERAREPSDAEELERAAERTRREALRERALERVDMDQFVAEMREELDRMRQWAEGVEQDVERGAQRFSEREQELFEAIQRDLRDVQEQLERFAPAGADAPAHAAAIQRDMRAVADRVRELEALRAAPTAP